MSRGSMIQRMNMRNEREKARCTSTYTALRMSMVPEHAMSRIEFRFALDNVFPGEEIANSRSVIKYDLPANTTNKIGGCALTSICLVRVFHNAERVRL